MAVNRKSRKKTVYRVKKGAQNAAIHFLSAVSIFLIIVLLTAFFILFQWKNVKIRDNLEQIEQLKAEILMLNAEKSRLETVRNQLLKQIPHLAREQLGLVIPVKRPAVIKVNREELLSYETKDREK